MAAPNLKEIEWAIHELKGEESSKANYIFLASLLRCRDELMGKQEQPQIAAYSQAAAPVIGNPISETLDRYGDSDFLLAVEGKDSADAWELMDSLMDSLRMTNPRIYESYLRRMRNL